MEKKYLRMKQLSGFRKHELSILHELSFLTTDSH